MAQPGRSAGLPVRGGSDPFGPIPRAIPPSAPFKEERINVVAATLEQLAALVRGRLIGDGKVSIQSARPVAEAGPGDITFIESERFGKLLRGSTASAAIVGPHLKLSADYAPGFPVIEVADPIDAFMAVRNHLDEAKQPRWTGIHHRAYIAPSAKLGADIAIYPLAYVGEDAVIGDGCTIHPGAVVGSRCTLGRGVTLHPNVVLYDDVSLGDRTEIHAGTVLGGDGFKYRQVDGRHIKVPHTGRVEVGSDVEIGSNCAIDRGTFGATKIGDGTKIDNLVMIAHNNVIGRHNLLCGQVGIAGSCTTGDFVIMAGQAGIKDHTEIGDKVIVGAQAGVHRNVPSNQQVLGSPAIPLRDQRRIFQMTARLPDMHRQLRELTARVALLMGGNPAEPAEPLSPQPDDPTGF
jgi:UDP-3-O-[3-hydroxymyristoyl] glucosamine N-acyltransferase